MTDRGCIKSDVGIGCKKVDDTMKNVAKIEKKSSKVMNEIILNIITNS